MNFGGVDKLSFVYCRYDYDLEYFGAGLGSIGLIAIVLSGLSTTSLIYI
jgi:hypothetical protein